MISVVIPTFNDEARLAACLSPLVPAAMEGLVRELVVVDGGSTDATLEIADDAGARIVRSMAAEAGVAVARGPWVMVLDPGVRLDYGWEAAIRRHIEACRTPARFRIAPARGGLFARLMLAPVAAHLIVKSDAGRLRLVRQGNRLEARIGQVDRLDARGLI